MGYRAELQSSPETVSDLEVSAWRRLDEAGVLHARGRYHAAIYIAGLAAEMYLKTACFFVAGATPADPVVGLLSAVRPRRYRPPFDAEFEAGHGLWFWAQELLVRRLRRGLRVPKRFRQVMAGVYNDWFIGMRYRPGSASAGDAARFVALVEWLADNHAALRR